MKKKEIVSLLSEFSYQHVLEAMEIIDKLHIPSNRKSISYNVLSSDSRSFYPPPLLIEKAYKISTNKDLPPNFFQNIGKKSPHFKRLEELGFTINSKSNMTIQFNTIIFKKVPANEVGTGTEIAVLKKYFTSGFIDDPKDFLEADDNEGSRSYSVKTSYKDIKYNYEIKAYKTQEYSKDRRLILNHSNDPLGLDRETNDYLAIMFNNKITKDSPIEIKVIDKNNNFYSEIEKLYGKRSGLVFSKNSHPELFESFINEKLTPSPMKQPLNQILYGPPGTGKTYNTVLKAAEIIENRKINSYDEALEIFKTNLHNQIEFITFHQNYSYEDFIQGLRPETDNKSSLVFDKKDGVFKKIADKALENLKLVEKAPEELSSEAKFDKGLEHFADKVLESEDNFKINDTAYIFEVEEDAFRYTGQRWTNHTNGLRMKFSDLKEFYKNDVKSRKDIKKLVNISSLANQHATYYYLVYSEILQLLPKKAEGLKKVRRKNYVIIIDEINRANISRVFGELITLIEPDKRSHGKIPLEAKLPSGDPFFVPSNLFIIGTMNTADKSIALLDIALRRRFEFESMYPKYEIEGQEIYDVDILRKINQQIIKSKGHDFQIGHAYFMGENKNLIERMNKKVIPLLLEYYMNDEKEVKRILNSAGLAIEENNWPLKITGKND